MVELHIFQQECELCTTKKIYFACPFNNQAELGAASAGKFFRTLFKVIIAIMATNKGKENAMKQSAPLQPLFNRKPADEGPMMAPIRPMPIAQPIPVLRIDVW